MDYVFFKGRGFSPAKLLSSDEYSETWFAFQTSLNRSVRLRVFKPETSPELVTYFLGVAKLFARVKCDGVVSVIDIIDDATHPAVVLENISGKTLTQCAPLSRQDALRAARDIARTLCELRRQRGIVLGNLSADTVTLSPTGAKIVDFFHADQTDEPAAVLADFTSLGKLLLLVLPNTPDADLDSFAKDLLAGKYSDWEKVIAALDALTGGASVSRRRVKKSAAASGTLVIREEPAHQLAWILLFAWFGFIVWYRLPSAPKPLPPEAPPIPVQEETPATPPPEPVQEKTPQPETPVPKSEVSKPAIPPPLAKVLANTLAHDGLQPAKILVAASEDIAQDVKDLFAEAPDPQTLAGKWLETQIGKTISVNYGGKIRFAVLRSFEDGVLSLEANGRAVELPFAKLPGEQVLEWIPRPHDAPSALSYASVLLRTPRNAEVMHCASFLPLSLQGVLIQASMASKSR